MELTEKNGHASIEEILASVRRIIAEEPSGAAPAIELGKPSQYPRGDGLLDDPSDFDLPSMFKTQAAAPQGDKPAPLFGRLSEAIRAASAGNGQGADRAEQSLSTLKLQRVEPADAAGAPHFLLSTFHEATAPRAEDLAAAAGGSPASAAPSFLAPAPSSSPPVAVAAHDEKNPSDAPASLTPQVPRQMVAFKDTRFRGMGAPPPAIVPSGSPSSPFEDAATAALVSAAGANAAAVPEPEPAPQPYAAPLTFADEQVAEEAPASLTAAIVASYPELAAEPVAADPPAPVPPPVPAAPAQSAPANAAPVEDSTADLLRPMLRQWLAENMPRMVEKALHIEVAETVKSTKK